MTDAPKGGAVTPTLSGVVVLCRPEQWRQAATVLSCCPRGFTPLIVLEPPPVDDDEYLALYDRYVAARNARDVLSGTTMARQAASEADIGAANAATEAAARTLAPFRSWWLHQTMIANLLAQAPPRLALLLCDPAPGELHLIEAVPYSRIGPQRRTVLPRGTTLLRLDGDSTALAEATWNACGREGALPQGVGPAGDGPQPWFAALWCGLRSGIPVLPGAPTVAPPETGAEREAVLVEVAPDATGLVGVQYAHARDAKLVLVPAPDMRAIDEAVATMPGAADPKLFGGLEKALLKIWQGLTESPDVTAALQRIEQAVSAAVPDAALEAVGPLDLTAFTGSVPYNFVRKGGADWSDKAIGLVAGDPSLLVLTELLAPPVPPTFGFSLVLDTQAFDTTETEDVMSLLRERPTAPLLLSGKGAANLNLLRLSAALPIELVHLNTHGLHHAVVLADGRLPGWRLFGQALNSRPFVFNNSCLSWTGVGREFVRVGARGYVGTLWPVQAQSAAELARIALRRASRLGWPVARAIRGTGLDRHTSRAYVFAGTVSARLAGDIGERPPRASLAAGIKMLLGVLNASLSDRRTGPALQFIEPMRAALWRRADALLKVLDHTWPEPDADRVQIALDRAAAFALSAEALRESAGLALQEVEAARAVVQQAPDESGQRTALLARLLYFEGSIELAAGRVADALATLDRSVAADPGAPGPLQALSDARRRAGQIGAALEAARQALRAAGEEKVSRLGALGRIGQLTRMQGDRQSALDAAREGFALATELDDLPERATFKGDEARTLILLGRGEEAVASARIYRDLARQAYGDREELAACGALVQALTLAGRLGEAEAAALEGLAEARATSAAVQEAQFLKDRARIAASAGRLPDATALGLEAARAFAGCGDYDRCRDALGLTTEVLNEACRAGDPAVSATLAHAVDHQVALMPLVPQDLRAALGAQCAWQIDRLAAMRATAALHDVKARLLGELFRLGPAASNELRALAEAVAEPRVPGGENAMAEAGNPPAGDGAA